MHRLLAISTVSLLLLGGCSARVLKDVVDPPSVKPVRPPSGVAPELRPGGFLPAPLPAEDAALIAPLVDELQQLGMPAREAEALASEELSRIRRLGLDEDDLERIGPAYGEIMARGEAAARLGTYPRDESQLREAGEELTCFALEQWAAYGPLAVASVAVLNPCRPRTSMPYRSPK